MTSPDGGTPPGSTGPLSLFASKTGEEWRDEAMDDFLGNFDQIDPVNSFIVLALKAIALLLSGIPFVGDDLAAAINHIANGINIAKSTADTAQGSADVAYTNAGVAYTKAVAVETAMADVVTDVEAAANAAAAAQEKADVAYGLSSYWEAEALVASSGVVQGVNELVIGLCQNVPDDTDRFVTDLHIALKSQVGGVTIRTVKVDLNGANPTVVHTAVLGANVTRVNYNALDIETFDKERVHWEIPPGGIVGSIAPTVLQCLIFGVLLAEA